MAVLQARRLSPRQITRLSRQLQELLPPPKAARAVGLLYVQDTEPGIKRVRRGTGFIYLNLRGQPVRDRRVLDRIRALAIPPAWRSVWICRSERGHIQATGLDQRGRKQYRYHPEWRAIRDATKFDKLPQFAEALNVIRERVDAAFALPGLPREKILAAVIRLLDVAHIRVGNTEYADANGSYGLTTLENRHMDVHGSLVKLRFRGKSGLHHEIEFRDRRLAHIMKRCSELPGQLLFQYLDDEGQPHRVSSTDVNAILREWTGAEFSAKDFRTWSGTVQFVRTIQNDTTGMGLTSIIKDVARSLGNTPAVCRKYYIHPKLLEAYSGGTLRDQIAEFAKTAAKPIASQSRLDETERLVLHLLNGGA